MYLTLYYLVVVYRDRRDRQVAAAMQPVCKCPCACTWDPLFVVGSFLGRPFVYCGLGGSWPSFIHVICLQKKSSETSSAQPIASSNRPVPVSSLGNATW